MSIHIAERQERTDWSGLEVAGTRLSLLEQRGLERW